jgi:hypothetical protein
MTISNLQANLPSRPHGTALTGGHCQPWAAAGVEYKMRSLEQRLWSRVSINDATGCWEWEGAHTPWGCGTISVRPGVWARVPRLAYEMLVGPIPPGHFVCHHCDNPPCCNPAHLFTGTCKDNVADCIQKGRFHTGRLREGLNPRIKLTRSVVLQAAERIRAGVVPSVIGKELGISAGSVESIAGGRTWSWFTGIAVGSIRRWRA